MPFVGLVAAWLGVKVALYEMDVSEFWLEDDSLTVIQWLSEFQREITLILSSRTNLCGETAFKLFT